jgi:hypothetical protein
MRPDDLLSKVDPIHNAAVKPKNIIQHPAGAGCNHQRVDPPGNLGFQEFNALLAAKYRTGFDRQPLLLGHIAEFFDIDCLSDPTSFADIYTIFFIHG